MVGHELLETAGGEAILLCRATQPRRWYAVPSINAELAPELMPRIKSTAGAR